MTASNRPEHSSLSIRCQDLLEQIAEKQGCRKWATEDPERVLSHLLKEILTNPRTYLSTVVRNSINPEVFEIQDKYGVKTIEEAWELEEKESDQAA